jgi:Rab-GTPase-TBC domain
MCVEGGFLTVDTFHRVLLYRQQALFHVLAAYSMYNTEVGYCQGMSQIAALLLMYLNEEVSFSVIDLFIINLQNEK